MLIRSGPSTEDKIGHLVVTGQVMLFKMAIDDLVTFDVVYDRMMKGGAVSVDGLRKNCQLTTNCIYTYTS